MRAASYSTDGIKPIIYNKISTTGQNQPVFTRLLDLIRSVWQDNLKVEMIILASAGPLDPKTGYIYDAPNIPGWKDFPLGEKLHKEFGIPVIVGNDANLAALGEWKFGSGKGHHDLIYMTLSTGIGGGIICNDQLVEGAFGLAGELGHITVLPDGPTCSCGKQGHLEAISSGQGIVQYVDQMLMQGESSILSTSKELNAWEVAKAAETGDELAIKAFSRAGFYLGLALASIIHIFNPSIIILGGGVSKSGALIIDPMIEKMKVEIMDKSYLENLEIVTTKLGDEVGLLGALVLGRQKLQIE